MIKTHLLTPLNEDPGGGGECCKQSGARHGEGHAVPGVHQSLIGGAGWSVEGEAGRKIIKSTVMEMFITKDSSVQFVCDTVGDR